MTPELETYIESHIEPEPSYLKKLEKETNLRRVNGRMCAGHIQGRLLKMLTSMIAPERVLELGTFTGYSALCIAEGLPADGRLVTVEANDEIEEDIRNIFSESGLDEKIELKIGNAIEICKELPDESFNLIFIDADKREYPEYYTEAKRLLKEGGYIIADNILWDSHVVEEGRHDAQTEGVKKFNRLAASDNDMETAIIPIRDGLSIIRKRTKQATRLL